MSPKLLVAKVQLKLVDKGTIQIITISSSIPDQLFLLCGTQIETGPEMS